MNDVFMNAKCVLQSMIDIESAAKCVAKCVWPAVLSKNANISFSKHVELRSWSRYRLHSFATQMKDEEAERIVRKKVTGNHERTYGLAIVQLFNDATLVQRGLIKVVWSDCRFQ